MAGGRNIWGGIRRLDLGLRNLYLSFTYRRILCQREDGADEVKKVVNVLEAKVSAVNPSLSCALLLQFVTLIVLTVSY